VPDDLLHREREEHDADDHREMRVRVHVAGERHAFRALEIVEHPLAADRKEVEVGEPERGGDEEPEDRGHDLAQPDADPGGADPDRDERLAERDDQHQAVALREVRRVHVPARRPAQRGADVGPHERGDPEPDARRRR
jgi:hypothetical protein